MLLGPEGQVHDATPVACELLGASDPEDLRSRWNAIHAQLAPLLRGYADVAQSIDLSLEQGGRTRRVRCEVQATEKVDAAGYRLDAATLVDLFPHTSHVEVVTTWRRSSHPL